MSGRMSVIPPKVRAAIDASPRSKVCAASNFPGHVCGGRLTREHAMYYAGQKIQEAWAIVVICACAHGVDIGFQDGPGELPKEVRQWIALNQASDEDLDRFPRAFPSFRFQRDRLNKKYGVYVQSHIPASSTSINY